ncbi:T9SS type A sorting domain-containing protein [Flavobacterium sp. UW10123]|uniref:DUF7619 domain-containing protein n=1 Tax=Flavobacterium sp. UW10123 TaxID=3230800 RepID=UPI003398C0D2
MKQLYSLILLLLFPTIYSQNPADIDITYDYANHNLFLNGNVKDGVTLPDGKAIIIGNFTGYFLTNGSFNKTGSIIRLNPDLSYDNTFKLGTRLTGTIYSIAKQSTGKILIAGNLNSLDGNELASSIIRLNADGSLDNTFKKINIGIISKIQVDANDKIYAIYDRSLWRLTANGDYDSTFLNNGSFSNTLYAYVPKSDGSFYFAGGGLGLTINKLDPTGRFDSTFKNENYTFDCSIATMALQSDGKILIGGQFWTYGGKYAPSTISVNRLARLNPDGSFDSSFVCPELVGQYEGSCTGGKVTFVIEQPDKKILVGGVFPPYNGAPSRNLIRLNSDGSIDNTFVTGTGTNVGINSISLRPNGNIFVCASDISNPNQYVPLVYNTYTVGTFFELDKNGTLLHHDKSTAIDPQKIIKGLDGKYNIIGESRSPYHRGIKTIDTDGKLSLNANLFSGFDNKPTGWSGQVKASSCLDGVVQKDGKIIVVGYFDKYNDVLADGLIRLNSDYTIDTSFNIGQSFTYKYGEPEVHSVALQPDGKILIGGYFDSFKGTPVNGKIIRLNSNGTLDSSFNYSNNDGNAAYQIEVKTDGKILMNVFGLVRLNSDGTLDTSFNPEPYPGYSSKFALLPNGKIIVPHNNKIKRINSDGTIDPSFNSLEFETSIRNSFAIQSDGKILCAGTFNIYNVNGVKGLIRLNVDGSVDQAFNTGTGFNGPVETIFIEPDGKILVAGSFTNYNGAWCNGSVKLLGGDAFLVSGQNKFDSNNNGCDANDTVFPNLKLNIASGAVNTELIANKSGDYAISLPSGKHTFTPKLENPTYFNISPQNVNVDFPSQLSPAISNFCIAPNGVHPDLEIILIPINAAIPGFTSKYKILYKNKGNQLQSGSVNLTFDNTLLTIVSTTPAVSSKTTNTLKWNFSNMLPFQSGEISLSIRINKPTDTPPADSGTVLKYSAEILSSLTDDTPTDNIFNFDQIVVNSLDPNDKTCLQGASIQSSKIGEYIHYVIRFENSGTYKAQNITVRDIIDTSKFDISSLIAEAGSHLFTTKISEGNKVEFLFEGINLPFDDANNDGYVSFKIRTKSNLKPGDEFSNSSSIYFDYNSAIVTNTATTKIEANLSNPDFLTDNIFTTYPNPTEGILFINQPNDNKINSLNIYNVLGQLIIAYPNFKNLSSIDVSNLASGSYFIKINSEKGTFNSKFIKK